MKKRIRRIADIELCARGSVADEIRSLACQVKGMSERTKYVLAVPAGLVITYFGVGLIRLIYVIALGQQQAIPESIPLVDWWWLALVRLLQ